MLFLLRQLRRLELRKRSGQYFVYAIGEIILIVLGILIAVQIGDWKELKNQRVEVSVYLSDIKVDLDKEAVLLEELLLELKSKEVAVESLKGHFKVQPLTELEVQNLFGQLTNFVGLRPLRSSYESFKDSGLPMNNRDLKLMLIDYYEDYQVSVVDVGDDYEWFWKSYHLPFIKKHMVEAVYRRVAIPKDYTDPGLKEDFLKNTFDFDTLIGNSIERMDKLLEMNGSIKVLIDQELSNH